MKLSIVTITCRNNPRISDMARTLTGSLGDQPVEIEWIIVDELKRATPTTPISTPENFFMKFTTPLETTHRLGEERAPAHNSARNAGLFVATGDYVVFLNDCTLVTRNWVALVADVAREGLGLRCRAFSMHDMAVPEHGLISYRDHNDRLRPVPPTTVAGPCWGAPRRSFDEIHGFDLAYDGEDKGHDIDAVLRLARVGVRFVSSERAFVISLRRTKTKGEVSTRKEVFVGARNQKLLNQLQREPDRTLPVGEASPTLSQMAVGLSPTPKPPKPPGAPRINGDAAAPAAPPPPAMIEVISDPLLDAMDDIV